MSFFTQLTDPLGFFNSQNFQGPRSRSLLVEVQSNSVYRGLWTDVDRGPILGQTITTVPQIGSIIVAVLAILSTLGTAHLWNLIVFALHQIRANGVPADAFFHQQQALLRTLPPPTTVVADTLKLWWSWKGHTKRPFVRTLVLALIAAVFSAVTIAASIFSSLVVSSTDLVVLARSDLCGHWNGPTSEDYMAAVAEAADAYSQKCYYKESQQQVCDIFLRTNMTITAQKAPCAFNSGVCPPQEAVTFDSGYMDVNDAFGLNLPSNSRVSMRKKTTCQILPLEDRTFMVSAVKYMDAYGPSALERPPFPDEELMLVAYGTFEPVDRFDGELNLTWTESLWDTNTTFTHSVMTFQRWASEGLDMLRFQPIVELVRNDGDTTVMLVFMNALGYDKPVDDPLFAAHRLGRLDLSQNKTSYIADYPVRAMGCLEQYQFCHSQTSGENFCSELGGVPFLNSTEKYDQLFPKANNLQRAVIKLLARSNYLFSISMAGRTWATESAPAGGYSVAAPPNDQWIRDLTRWEIKAWAALQFAISDYALGPALRLGESSRVEPKNKAEKELCSLLRMRKSGGMVNINVFGLAMIIAFSIFITILDIALLKFLIYLSRFRRALAPRIDRWIQDGVWQLQRRAYESHGHRTWVDLENEIPRKTDNEILPYLPIMWVPKKDVDIDCSSCGTSIRAGTMGMQGRGRRTLASLWSRVYREEELVAARSSRSIA